VRAFAWGGKRIDYFGNVYGELVIVLVHPTWQGRSIGSLLIQEVNDRLRQKDLRLSILYGNRADSLYRRLGYVDFIHIMRKEAQYARL
jgi:GNAT superfamily N-acetyltransferase